ncbi:MAG: sensor histidine kinase [Myxococcales bacterium]|nr:sensor histidine kinase [Myxococcales bacterium]
MSRARLQIAVLALAVFGLVALGAVVGSRALAYDTPFGGFFVYRSGAITSLWRAHWAGRQAGLRVRDVIIGVDGERVGGGPSIAAALDRRRDHAQITLDVVHPNGARGQVTVPLSRLTKWDLGSTFLLPFSIGLVYLLLGATIYRYKRTREAALGCALCLVAAAFYLSMFDAHTTWRFTRVWLIYPLLGPLSVHLFALFPEVRPRWARRRVLGPIYAVGLAVVACRQWAIDDPRMSDTASLASAAMLSVEFAIDLGLLALSMTRGASPAVRNRAKSIFVGLALTCTTAVAWQFASRLAGPSRVLTADQAMVLSALFPALIAYAILKRNLFDLDAVLRASVIYGGATALVLSVYFAAVAVASHWATMLVGQTSAVALTMAVAVLFHPLRLGVQRIVDKLLYRDSRMPALLELLRALPSVEDVPSLAEVSLQPLLRLTRARGVLLFVPSRLGRLDVVGRAGDPLDGSDPGASVHLPLGGAFEAALTGTPRPQAVRDLVDEAAAECAPVASLGIELLVPLVGRGRLDGLLAFTAPRGGVYGYGVLHALADAAPQLALALANAALVAERAMRERLAALGQLAAVIVHEVKNPLGIIKVSAGALRQRAHDDATRTLTACIEDEVDRMDATVRRLLELARPPEPALKPTDVGALIRQTLDRLAPELSAAHIDVRCELAISPKVNADAEWIRRALLNLFLNAREAMPSGGALSVRLRPAAELVEIEVEDSGVGMDEATRRQLFRPFFTTRHGGTGLGLAIVKRVIEDHKGAIRVESRLGKGSRFTLTLPM